jgi:hypothetical protein
MSFNETRDTGFLLGCLDQLWPRVPGHKPLSVGVVLLDLVPASAPTGFIRRRQSAAPEIVAAHRPHQRPLRDRLRPPWPDVRAFKGHAAFHRVPESWEF